MPGGEQVARGMGDHAVELVDRVPIPCSGEVVQDEVEGLPGQQQAGAAGEPSDVLPVAVPVAGVEDHGDDLGVTRPTVSEVVGRATP